MTTLGPQHYCFECKTFYGIGEEHDCDTFVPKKPITFAELGPIGHLMHPKEEDTPLDEYMRLMGKYVELALAAYKKLN